MLEISYIRQNPELVKERLSIRGKDFNKIIDAIVFLDEEIRNRKNNYENFQASLKKLSSEVGEIKKKKDDMSETEKEQLSELLRKVEKLKISISFFGESVDDLNQKLIQNVLLLPNLPHLSVPKGKNAEDNVKVREGGIKPTLLSSAKPHWDIIKDYDLVNFEIGVKLTGSGFPVFKGQGAKLQRSLIQFFLNYNTEAGYTEYIPPLVVNETSAYGTGQLPDKEGQMYFIKEDEFYLIPTAEVPVTNIYRDEIVKQSDLPIKMTAYTPCFRREAGSFGSDVRGLNRVHQFDKVEIIQIVHPNKSYEVLEEMVKHVERLLQFLELPYRIVRLCGGDMGFTSALTYDFEVYSAAQQKWLEVSSVSNFETFQTNRMKIRYKDEAGKTHFLHTLNGSSLALPRIVAALLENNQKENAIHLPEVLHQYFGASMISKG